jgi:hypothetical protein
LDHDLDRIVENLTHELTSWKTLSIRVQKGNSRIEGKSAPSTIEDYRETASGQRWLQTLSLSSGDPKLIYSAICDGSKCWELGYLDGKLIQAVIEPTIPRERAYGFTVRPSPLSNLYVGLTPLNQAIRTAEQAGEETVIGRPCDGFRLSGVKRDKAVMDYVYYLDRETSIPLRIDVYRPDSPPGVTPQAGPWLGGRWEAETLDTVGRYHVPLKSNQIAWKPPDASGNQEEMARLTVTVEAIEYDQPIDVAIFRPELGPGVSVIDTIAKTSYETPPPANQAETKAATTTPARPPIEAIPPGHWSSSASAVGIGLGICILLAGVLLWLRGARR